MLAYGCAWVRSRYAPLQGTCAPALMVLKRARLQKEGNKTHPSPEHVVNAMLGNLRTLIFHTNSDQTTNEWASRLVGKETVWRESFSQNTGWNEGTNDSRNSGTSNSYTSSLSREGGFSSGSSYGTTHGTSQGTSSGTSGGQSRSMTEHREYGVEPEDFNRDLKSGGARHDYIVTGVVMQAGRIFVRNRKHWMQFAFRQR